MQAYKEFRVGNLLCISNTDAKWGAFNTELETVIPFEYDEMFFETIQDDKREYLVAVKDGVLGLINLETKEFLPKETYADDFSGISFIKEQNGKFGIVDAYDNFVIQPIYDNIEEWNFQTKEEFLQHNNHNEKLYLVKLNGKFGIANNKGVLKEPSFDDIVNNEEFACRHYPYFEASVDGKYGYIDEHGDTIIDFEYKDVDCPSNLKITLAKTFDNHLHFINLKTQKVVADFEADDIDNYTIEHNHICILTKKDNMYHVIDDAGKVTSEFANTEETAGNVFAFFNEKLLECVKDNKYVLCNLKGESLDFSKNYKFFVALSGTTNFIAQHNDGFDEILDINGNVLQSNMKNAFCPCNDENDFGRPPVIYYIDGKDEAFETKPSITPYEETYDNSVCLHDVLKDDESFEEIDSDGKHYGYIISEKSIRVIDNQGHTTKEIAFTPVIEDEDLA